GAAIHKNILIVDGRISGKADGCNVVGFGERGLVQGLNVSEYVGVLVARRGKLVGGQGVKHESVIRVRRVGELDFNGLFAGFQNSCMCRHFLEASFCPGSHRVKRRLSLRSERATGGRARATSGTSVAQCRVFGYAKKGSIKRVNGE